MASLARRFNISAAAAGKSVKRGGEIAKEEGYALIWVNKLTSPFFHILHQSY